MRRSFLAFVGLAVLSFAEFTILGMPQWTSFAFPALVLYVGWKVSVTGHGR